MGPLQKKWLEALRSGKYKQGGGMLRSQNDEFCCLGVACEVIGLEAVITDPSSDCHSYGAERSGGYAPREVREALRLYSASGFPHGASTPGLRPLADMNDEGQTFAEIADHLEKYEKAYFHGEA